jgi:hypothetical protein
MPEIEAIEVESDDPIGPFGAKEAGEGTQLLPVTSTKLQINSKFTISKSQKRSKTIVWNFEFWLL